MLEQITYYRILGVPVIVYLGILTLLSALATAYTGYKRKPINVHTNLARITVGMALVHGILALMAYLG